MEVISLISNFCSGILEGNILRGPKQCEQFCVQCALPSAQIELRLLNSENWCVLLLNTWQVIWGEKWEEMEKPTELLRHKQ